MFTHVTSSSSSIIIFTLCLFVSLGHSMDIIEYDIPLIHAKFNVQSVLRPETQWLLILHQEDGQKDGAPDDQTPPLRLLMTIKTILENDHCLLSRSKSNQRLIILHIYCMMHNFTVNGGEERPPLESTLSYLEPLFGKENVFIEQDGTYRTTDTLKEDVLLPHATRVQYNAPWHLDRIDSRTRSFNGEYSYFVDGSAVDVYIIDSGLNPNHVEFEGRAVFLFNAVGDDRDYDCLGHGTHVAGLIGSKTYGVAKKTRLYGVKVLDCNGDGVLSDLLEGLNIIRDHVASRAGSRRVVINLSLGGPPSNSFDRAIRDTVNQNIAVVVAAGNNGDDACKYSPCRLGIDLTILAVGASTRGDQRASWSNYGECVDTMAPGEEVSSTFTHSINAPTNLIATRSGTSMGAPIVSGVLALLFHQNRSLTVRESNHILVEQATSNAIQPRDRGVGSSALVYSFIDISHTDRPVIFTNGANSTSKTPSVSPFIHIVIIVVTITLFLI